MRQLHERLHAFREGIAGSNVKDKDWLLTEVRELIKRAWRVDPQIVPTLLHVQEKLKQLKEYSSRLPIDDIICTILNENRVKAVA